MCFVKTVQRPYVCLNYQHCWGVSWSHRKSVKLRTCSPAVTWTLVLLTAVFEVELQSPGCMRTCWSLSLVLSQKGQGWTYYLYSGSTEWALPVSSALTAGCHQRDCQSQPTETPSVGLSKNCAGVTLLQSQISNRSEQLRFQPDQMLLGKLST